MTDEKEIREKFEAWWYGCKYMQVVFSSEHQKQLAWDAWKVGRQSRQSEIDALKAELELYKAAEELALAKLEKAQKRIEELKADYEMLMAGFKAKNIELEKAKIRIYELERKE